MVRERFLFERTPGILPASRTLVNGSRRACSPLAIFLSRIPRWRRLPCSQKPPTSFVFGRTGRQHERLCDWPRPTHNSHRPAAVPPSDLDKAFPFSLSTVEKSGNPQRHIRKAHTAFRNLAVKGEHHDSPTTRPFPPFRPGSFQTLVAHTKLNPRASVRERAANFERAPRNASYSSPREATGQRHQKSSPL
jgi:hypothetical protein